MTVRVALVGATASGKSRAAHRAALAVGGVELVSLDAMAVYRGMDLGTAKPTSLERAEVTYHLVDVRDPSEELSVRRFRDLVDDALGGIARRRHAAVLVGGLGSTTARSWTASSHHRPTARCAKPWRSTRVGRRGRSAAPRARGPRPRRRRSRIDPRNERRLVRAVEVLRATGEPFSSFGPGLERYAPSSVDQLGITFDAARADLGDRRAVRRGGWRPGCSTSCRGLLAAPGGPSRTAPGRRATASCSATWRTGCRLDVAAPRACATRRLARRQWRWFRRDPRVTWVDDAGAAEAALCQRLSAAPSAGELRDWHDMPGAARRDILEKWHGAGNDFLVALRPSGDARLDGATAARWCDRHAGIGADGLLEGTLTASGLAISLHNADGSPAEVSGNGLRCLVAAGHPARPRAGGDDRRGDRRRGAARDTALDPSGARAWGEVDMGAVTVHDGGTLATGVVAVVGNPHVVVDDDGGDDAHLVARAVALTASLGAGANVEFLTVEGPNRLRIRVVERGAGTTLACGTGSCAVAAVAHCLGLTGTEVTVANPGGDLGVALDGATARLSGPAVRIGAIELDEAW